MPLFKFKSHHANCHKTQHTNQYMHTSVVLNLQYKYSKLIIQIGRYN
jgi:hypothetical protein